MSEALDIDNLNPSNLGVEPENHDHQKNAPLCYRLHQRPVLANVHLGFEPASPETYSATYGDRTHLVLIDNQASAPTDLRDKSLRATGTLRLHDSRAGYRSNRYDYRSYVSSLHMMTEGIEPSPQASWIHSDLNREFAP